MKVEAAGVIKTLMRELTTYLCASSEGPWKGLLDPDSMVIRPQSTRLRPGHQLCPQPSRLPVSGPTAGGADLAVQSPDSRLLTVSDRPAVQTRLKMKRRNATWG